MMKKHYLFLLAFAWAGTAFAQYTSLCSDPAGDNLQSSYADIKSISYKASSSQDSIWLKVKTYNAISPTQDFGIMFGLDTNLIGTDGVTWNGSNTAMKYDQALAVFLDAMSPVYHGYLTSGAGDTPLPVDVSRPDDTTFVIRTQLSRLDQNGKFNMIAGAGGFDIYSTKQTFDNAPNSGIVAVNVSTGLETLPRLISAEIYPNPCSDGIHWNAAGPGENMVLVSLSGELLKEVPYTSGYMDLSRFPAGIYLIRQGSQYAKVVKTE